MVKCREVDWRLPNRSRAYADITRLRDKSGFKKLPEGFQFHTYPLNRDGWMEGYVTVEWGSTEAEGGEEAVRTGCGIGCPPCLVDRQHEPRQLLRERGDGNLLLDDQERAWRRFDSNGEAKRQLFDYLEGFYNQRRWHSSVGRVSPAAFDRKMTQAAC
jgi:transposase InsO family protein